MGTCIAVWVVIVSFNNDNVTIPRSSYRKGYILRKRELLKESQLQTMALVKWSFNQINSRSREGAQTPHPIPHLAPQTHHMYSTDFVVATN